MTLRSRVALIRGSYWPVAIGLMTVIAVVGVAAPTVGLVGTFGAGIVVLLTWRPLANRLGRVAIAQHQARTDAALDEGDDEARRRLHAELDEYFAAFVPRSERQRRRLQAQALAGDEKWIEALQSIYEMGDTATGTNERVGHDNLIAWCCAHAGETARAVGLARANADAPTDARLRPYLLGTLGAALALDGQHAAALAPLREALALGGPRWAQAVRRYYLGEALAALGRLDEARAEYHEAVTIAPNSRWGRRARARLDAGPPSAYR